ncbi:MAG: YhjD/YihY/BrkB family envelope integrity protein [Kiritimatiellia bacterium]
MNLRGLWSQMAVRQRRHEAVSRAKLVGDFILLVTLEPLLGFMRDDGLLKGGMLAYYTFMSFLPIFLGLILVAGRLISPETALTLVENLVGQILPQSKEMVLREVTGLAQQKVWSVVSVVVLFWWMVPVASVLRATFASIFKTSMLVFKMRGPGVFSFALGKLYDMGSMLLIVALMAVLTGTGWLTNLAEVVGGRLPFMQTLVRFGIPNLAALLCLYVFFYLFVPDRRKPLAILTGTLITGILLKLMNPVFSLMLQFDPDYGYMFGSLKAIFLFFIWIYYASLSILFGAEVMSCLYRRRELVLRDQVQRLLSGDVSNPRYRFLARSYTRPLARGDEVFRQGDMAAEMFVVISGRLAMVKDGVVLAVMEKGRCFGEVGALLGQPRTATARVESEEAEVVALSPAHLSDPELLIKLLQDMAGRLVRGERRTPGSPPAADFS